LAFPVVFLPAAFFEGAVFFWLDLPLEPLVRLPEKAASQPSAYRWFVPTRVIVTGHIPSCRLDDATAADRPGKQSSYDTSI
jgi:hypothetical protein